MMAEQDRPAWMPKNPYANMGEGNIMAVMSDDAYLAQARKLVDELDEIWETRCKGNRESFGSFVLSLMEQLRKEVGL